MAEGELQTGKENRAPDAHADVPSIQSFEVAAITLIGALVVGGYTLGSLNRDAFFLLKFDVAQLPPMLICVALVSVPFLSLYSRVASRVPTGQLTSGYFLLVALGYLLMGRLILEDTLWAALVFYFYVTLAGVLSVSIFWLAVGARFYLRQAKKLFSFFGTGCVFGNLLGGAVGRWGAEHFAQNTLVSIAGVMFFGATLLSLWVFRAGQMAKTSETEEADGYWSGFRDLQRSPLMQAIALMLMVSVTLGTLADYQLQALAKETYPTQVELVQFFGTLYTLLGAATLVAQLFLTNRVLSKFGMFGGLLSLPIAALPGAIAMVAFPSIFCALLLRGAENGARFSLFSSGYELSYLPVEEHQRKRVKPVVDVLLKRCAAGLAALLIIFLTEFANIGHRGLAVATLFAVLFLAWTVWKVRTAYIVDLKEKLSSSPDDSFDDAMKTGKFRAFDAAFPQEHSGSWSTRIIFAPTLEAASELGGRTKTIFASDIWSTSNPKQPETNGIGALFQRLDDRKDLAKTLAAIHERTDIRFAAALLPLLAEEQYQKRVLKIFRGYGKKAVGVLADAALNEKELPPVRTAVIELLGRTNTILALATLKILLQSPNKHIRRSCSNGLLELRKATTGRVLSSGELLQILRLEGADDHAFLQENVHSERPQSAEAETSQAEYLVSLERRRRHLFRLLSLRYDLPSIQASFVALTGEDQRARDTAIEYLDNVLEDKIKVLAWPLIEAKAPTTELVSPPTSSFLGEDEYFVDTNSLSPAPDFQKLENRGGGTTRVPTRTNAQLRGRIRLAGAKNGNAAGQDTPLPVLEAKFSSEKMQLESPGHAVLKSGEHVIEATIVGQAHGLLESAMYEMRTAFETGRTEVMNLESLGTASDVIATEFMQTLLSAEEQPTVHWANFEASDVQSAFIPETNSILIDQTLRTENEVLQRTVMNELGHWLEGEMNNVDKSQGIRETHNSILKK